MWGVTLSWKVFFFNTQYCLQKVESANVTGLKILNKKRKKRKSAAFIISFTNLEELAERAEILDQNFIFRSVTLKRIRQKYFNTFLQ